MAVFVKLLVNHRPQALHGRSLLEAMRVETRQPRRLAAYYEEWRTAPAQLYRAPPSLVFAVIGQAKVNGKISPEAESTILAKLLTHWALRKTLDPSAACTALAHPQAGAPAT